MISRISLFYLMCVYLHSGCFADINSCDPHNKLYLKLRKLTHQEMKQLTQSPTITHGEAGDQT